MYNNNMTSVVQEHPSVSSKQYILNANDRCDQCTAQALVKVIGLAGELTFCGHHYEKIMNNPLSYKKMLQFAIQYIDERNKLIEGSN